MPNKNFAKRQLKFDKPRYLFTKTHKPKTKTQMFYDKNNELLILTTFSMTYWYNIKCMFSRKICIVSMTQL